MRQHHCGLVSRPEIDQHVPFGRVAGYGPQEFHAFAQASMRKEKAVIEMLGLQAK